jgi:hypothetical protein
MMADANPGGCMRQPDRHGWNKHRKDIAELMIAWNDDEARDVLLPLWETLVGPQDTAHDWLEQHAPHASALN